MSKDIVDAFNAAFNGQDLDAVMALMTDDAVFESTSPAPDGVRYEGQAAVRGAWSQLFADSPQARFTVEELWGDGERWTQRWRYDWGDGHVRGVDVMRIRDGKVAEKLSYVKG
ncbi:MAG: hypothetical protein QOK43_1222 [Acidimicrobiaceae bacterium]|jgi:ketosteroid isomerase-like protein|nr:hypothetical protein [Acidimicrobiaceae bacterium]MDQ1445734.1 hypothetical protein [Acidimicrobiaceae bacterium]